MSYYIYKHTLNGKSYIGFTSSTIEQRLREHIQDAANDRGFRHWHRAIRKYGAENIISACLEEVETREEALAREVYWVDYYKTYENGYNMTLGGDGGDTWSNHPDKEEIKKKLSRVWKGRKHTEESKKKMSIAAKNRGPMPREAIDRAEAKRQKKRQTGNYISPEGIERLREVGKKKVFDEDYRKKLSENAKKRPVVTCPHCNRTGSKNSYARWHFDNCKEKP